MISPPLLVLKFKQKLLLVKTMMEIKTDGEEDEKTIPSNAEDLKDLALATAVLEFLVSILDSARKAFNSS